MEKTVSVITVLFEDPFWICIYERQFAGRYEVCRIVFGAEPKDYEVYDFLLKNWKKLRFSPPVKNRQVDEKTVNPKRMQRKIKKEMSSGGVGTKAQQALGLMREQNKTQRKTYSREMREAEKQRRFDIKQEKRRDKHRGH